MATIDPLSLRTDNNQLETRDVLLISAYAGQILATIATATAIAVLLVGFTTDLVGFVLVAAGWLAVVSASPNLAKRGTARLADLDVGQRAPRTTRAVDAVRTYVLARIAAIR